MNVTYLTKALAEEMDMLKQATEHLALVQKDVDEVRAKLLEAMVAEGQKAHESSGLKVNVRTKKYPQVIDKDALERHIESLGLTAGFTVMRFDQVKARNEAVKKGWPGVDVEVRDELVVKAV